MHLYKRKIIQDKISTYHITRILRKGLLGKVFRDYIPTYSHWVRSTAYEDKLWWSSSKTS